MDFSNEEIKEALVERLVEKVCDHEFHLVDLVRTEASKQIKDLVAKKLNEAVEQALSAELDKILTTAVQPVNIWGEPTGEKTTIRDELSKGAQNYWNNWWIAMVNQLTAIAMEISQPEQNTWLSRLLLNSSRQWLGKHQTKS